MITKIMAVLTVALQNLVCGGYYAAERAAHGKYSDYEPFDPSWMDAAAYNATR